MKPTTGAAALGREINREGRGGMMLLMAAVDDDAGVVADAVATTTATTTGGTVGRYHNERWCCGMSVYEWFV